MKYAVLAGALALTLCAGICEAEDGKAKGSGASDTSSQSTAGGRGLKHIDLGDDLNQNVNSIGVMDPGQDYSENTGLPNVVQSDSDMEM